MQIIPKKSASVETHWKKELANAFTDLYELINFLQIDEGVIPKNYMSSTNTFDKNRQNGVTEFLNKRPTVEQKHEPSSIIATVSIDSLEQHSKARKLFPMRVPRPFAELMQKGNWHDPLLQQVIPQIAEFEHKDGFVTDPLQEQNGQINGLIHKYKSRVLIVVKGGCAVNCRYCFRRHFPYQDNQLNKNKYRDILEYIKLDENLNEVILSGGDPLMAKDEHLYWLINELSQINHLKRLRIHTRLPVVIPSRIDTSFMSVINSSVLKVIMVLHINHANEISKELKSKMIWLKQNDVTLLNQTVLLAGINNSSEVLEDLSEALFDNNILPYYLHLLDPVKGAAHFDVSKADAKKIMAELHANLPGFLVPKLVQELPNRKSKTPIDINLEEI